MFRLLRRNLPDAFKVRHYGFDLIRRSDQLSNHSALLGELLGSTCIGQPVEQLFGSANRLGLRWAISAASDSASCSGSFDKRVATPIS